MPERETFAEKRERLATGPRLRALEAVLTELESGDTQDVSRKLRPLALLLVDATLDADEFTLETAISGLQRAYGLQFARIGPERSETPEEARVLGRFEGLVEHGLLALERIPSITLLADLEAGGRPHQFLEAVGRQPGLSNDAIAEATDSRPEVVSRIGRLLQARGLIRRRKIGRRNSWHLTPRGTQMLQMLESGPAPRPRREHRLYAT